MTDETWVCSVLTFTLEDGSTSQAQGQVSVTSLGRVELTANFIGFVDLNSFTSGQTVTGTAENGFTIAATGVYPDQSNYEPSTNTTHAIFMPLDCKLIGPGTEPVTRQEIYVKSLQVAGRCSFSDGTTNYHIRTLPDANNRRKDTVRAILHTSSAVDFDIVLQLLSLAQRCIIRSPLRKYYSSSGLKMIHLVPSERPDRVTHPLIPWFGTELAEFMSQALKTFPSISTALELNRLIDIYCLSVTADYYETKFIFASVFMEGIKFYWAMNIAKKTPDYNARGLVRGFEKRRNKNGKPILYTFEELLNEMCRSYGLNLEFTFIDDRNALFHTGAPGAYQLGSDDSWQAIQPELSRLYRQIDQILLTLLKYNGPIHYWDTPNQTDRWPHHGS